VLFGRVLRSTSHCASEEIPSSYPLPVL